MKKVIILLVVYCSLLQTEAAPASINKGEPKIKNETNATSVNTTKLQKRNETTVVFNFDVTNKTYYYSVETPDETVKYESSQISIDSKGEEHNSVEGGYELNTNDLHYIVTYKADENGYRPLVKFNFGTKIDIGTRIGPPKPPKAGAAPKGIDPTVICSLAGGGCQ